MRQTLRRACAACAKSKYGCDLRTPRCSRCIKRNVQCNYANEPLTSTSVHPRPENGGKLSKPLEISVTLSTSIFGALDPFDSYPQTRLPQAHVQRLIYSFLHKIAFQYYPLDLNASSNPFLISWWPLALGDPALFHVSLQTACLDEELLARKGFQTSEMLMADSVALLRRKVEDTTLAVQDGTLNSVITLAAIEFGKGNTTFSEMHVNGAKRLVDLRGGINAVRQTSPLTARMISWVSMLIMGYPQFDTQDDNGIGHGIPTISEWQWSPITSGRDAPELTGIDLDEPVNNMLCRLRNISQRAQMMPISNTHLHDLTCFVIHRLLPRDPTMTPLQSSLITECIRYGIILYMFIIHGPTYYSHAVILNTISGRFLGHLKDLALTTSPHGALEVWLTAVGMVASTGTMRYQWFLEKAWTIVERRQLRNWEDTLVCIKGILWLETPKGESIFRDHWDTIFGAVYQRGLPDSGVCLTSSSNTPLLHTALSTISLYSASPNGGGQDVSFA